MNKTERKSERRLKWEICAGVFGKRSVLDKLRLKLTGMSAWILAFSPMNWTAELKVSKCEKDLSSMIGSFFVLFSLPFDRCVYAIFFFFPRFFCSLSDIMRSNVVVVLTYYTFFRLPHSHVIWTEKEEKKKNLGRFHTMNPFFSCYFKLQLTIFFCFASTCASFMFCKKNKLNLSTMNSSLSLSLSLSSLICFYFVVHISIDLQLQ